MTKLVLGVLLWSIVHFIPALATGFKKKMLNRFGEYSYKGVFTLVMLVALYLIISGWKATTLAAPILIFTPPDWGVVASMVLVLIGFILFLAPYPETNIKRILRHPQLIGMVSWGVGHMLAVGTARAMVLFGGLTVWAIIEIILLNRRDGVWIKPEKVPFNRDFSLVLFGALVYMAVLYTHHLLFGGTPLT